MAAEIIAPVDTLTHLPLPIVPPQGSLGRSDKHHPFHPEKHELLQGVSGLAVRNCRVQTTNYYTHHYRYHGDFVEAPLPETEEEKFKIVVMALAGYMPKQALSLSSRGAAKIVPLTTEAREYLWTSGQVAPDPKGRNKVADFLKAYVFSQDFSSMETTLEQFLKTPDMERRRKLGELLLSTATYQATTPLKLVYSKSWQSELLPPKRQKAVGKFLFQAIVGQEWWQRDLVFKQLHQKLSA